MGYETVRHISFFRMPVVASLVLAFSAWVLTALAARAGLLESSEFSAYDWFVIHRNVGPLPRELVLVDFDNKTIKAVGGYPVPRRILAEAINKIAAGQPERIGLDWILSEPRAKSEDQELADAIKKAGNIILTDAYPSRQLLGNEPLPEFRDGAQDVAFANFLVDQHDGLIRRMLLGISRPKGDPRAGEMWLSLPAALMTYHQGKPPTHAKRADLAIWRFGSTEVPLDDTRLNSALIGFWNPSLLTTISARRVLEADFSPSVFKGKIVLVGQSNSEGKDLYPTPVFRFQSRARQSLTSGVAIHAAALTTLLTGKTIRVLEDRRLWALNLLLAWVVVALIVKLKPAYSMPGALLTAAGVLLLASFFFIRQGLWIKVVSSEVAMGLGVPAGLGYRFIQQRRERAEVMGLLGGYLSPEVAAEVWKRHQGGENVLRGDQRTVTVLFSDIRDFTKHTAGRPPDQVLDWLNRYLAAMDEIIRKNGGLLNRFIGDGIMALFGAPHSGGMEQDAYRAVLTALQMIQRVKELNSDGRDGHISLQAEIRIGIGIETGEVRAGNVGSRERFEYTVIGDTANLASRLEALTKQFNTSIVIGPQTWELVHPHFNTALLGEDEVRGFPGRICFFTVNGFSSEVQS
jgi:adenylate cyclase